MTSELSLTLGTSVTGKSVVLRGIQAAQHRHVMGLTGMGKSKLLESLALQLLNQHVTFALIDPSGDLCDHLLATLVELGFFTDDRAYARLLYVDFTNSERAVPFNVLAQPAEAHVIASGVLESWKRAWSSLSGGSAPALENLLLAGSYVLAVNGEPLTQLQTLLTDGIYRDRLLARVADAQILAFFEKFEEAGRRAGMLSESTLRRIFLLTFSPVLRDSLGSRTNRLQFRRLMDAGVSLLFNLGGLDPEVQRFLGCLLTVGMEEAALSRADTPEEARRPFHLIVDEFPIFSAQSGLAMERVLSLTRKYGLSLTLANQTWGQVPRDLQSALQNTTFITFRLGPDDAAWAASRVGTIDPNRIKVNPQGRAVFVSAGEQREEWERYVSRMRPQEALLRLGEQTIPFRTLQVPSQRSTRQDLLRIKARYAQLLLLPRPSTQPSAATPQQRSLPPPPPAPASPQKPSSASGNPGGTEGKATGGKGGKGRGRRARHQRLEPLTQQE